MKNILSQIDEFNHETNFNRKKILYPKLFKRLIEDEKFQDSLNLSKNYFEYCLANNHNEEQAKSLINIGLSNFHLYNEEYAIKYYLDAVNILKSQDKINDVAEVFNYISEVFHSIKDLGKAIEYLTKAIEITEKQSDEELMKTVYLNLSRLYKESGQLEKAGKFLQKAHNFIPEMLKNDSDKVFVITYYINAAQLDTLQGKHKSALSKINESISLASKMKNPKYYIIAAQTKADILSNLDEDGEAVKFLEELLHYFDNGQFDDLHLQTLKSISEKSEKKGDLEKAYSYYRKFVDLEEAIDNKRIIQKTELLEAKFDQIIDDKEKELFRLKNMELEETLNKLNRSYEELITTEKEKIKAEKLNAALNTVIETSSIIEKPLNLIEKNLSLVIEKSDVGMGVSRNYERIRENINRIRMIMDNFGKLKDVKLKDYVSGVKMLDVEG